jgi:hypothetical protein
MLQAELWTVAASICLTKLVKGPVSSRAKTMATGFLPFCQTWQFFSPADGPLTFSTWNGPGTLSPGWGPDLSGGAAKALPNSSAAASDPLAVTRFLITNYSSRHENAPITPVHTIARPPDFATSNVKFA